MSLNRGAYGALAVRNGDSRPFRPAQHEVNDQAQGARSVVARRPPLSTREELDKENGDLQEEVSDLRAENKRLQRQLLATGERENAAQQYNTAVRDYAKSFAFSRLVWLSSTGKELLLVDLPEDYSPVPNWPDKDVTDREAKQMALEREMWEIQQHLTSLLRETTLTATFFSKVNAHMQEMRSTFQNKLRAHASALLSHFPTLGAIDTARILDDEFRAANPRFLELLGHNSDPTATRPRYPLLAPIIFADGDSASSADRLFKNPIISKILIMVLFGPDKIGESGPFNAPKGCNAYRWGVTAVTPGMIALAALGARYLVCGDNRFCEEGNHTGIGWSNDYLEYRRLLINNASKPRVKNLLRDLDRALFANSTRERASRARRVVAPRNEELDLLERELAEEDDGGDQPVPEREDDVDALRLPVVERQLPTTAGNPYRGDEDTDSDNPSRPTTTALPLRRQGKSTSTRAQAPAGTRSDTPSTDNDPYHDEDDEYTDEDSPPLHRNSTSTTSAVLPQSSSTTPTDSSATRAATPVAATDRAVESSRPKRKARPDIFEDETENGDLPRKRHAKATQSRPLKAHKTGSSTSRRR